MKVYKFFYGEIFHVIAAETKATAITKYSEEVGATFTEIQEIPELEWDVENINIYEDNDFRKTPEKVSIRTVMNCDYPEILCSNSEDFD
jgi:hypothetical protein